MSANLIIEMEGLNNDYGKWEMEVKVTVTAFCNALNILGGDNGVE